MSKLRPLIRLDNVSLRYGNLEVLRGLSFAVSAGEIHALVGEHGAGKSSLIGVLDGSATPNGGRIVVDGRAYESLSVRAALDLGISTVKQAVLLCDHLTVATNIYMNQPRFYLRHRLSKRAADRSVARFLDANGIDLELTARAGTLKLADRVLTEVMRACYREPRVLILDEALEKLTADGLERVVAMMRTLRDSGGAVLFVTHRVDDIFQIADRVSVLRQGEILVSESVHDIDKFSLVKMAYTQLPATPTRKGGDTDFYHLLKYNQAILENLPINLLVVDTAMTLKLVNNHASVYFGIDAGPDPGVNLRDVFASSADLYARLAERVASPAPGTLFGERFDTADGTRILNISIVPIRDESWRIGSIVMIEDATERETLREQVELTERLGSIGILASGMAHEICNPLEIISNDITYLKTLYGSTIDLSILQEIKEEVDSITRIVQNLDRLPGPGESPQSPLRVAEIAASVVALVAPVAEQHGVALEFHDEAGTAAIRASGDDLRQTLLNLIKNGLEAVDRRGRVTVTVRTTGEVVEIVVEDDGPGIAAADRTQVFLPFVSTKSGGNSTRGLGLYVSHQLVTRNGGTIDAGAGGDGGCCFTVRFAAVAKNAVGGTAMREVAVERPSSFDRLATD